MGDLLTSMRMPYGCEDVKAGVLHHPVKGQLAELAREMYYVRKAVEQIAHNEMGGKDVQFYAGDLAKYANNLEFVARQIGLAMDMPILVNPPYLPVDLHSFSLPAILAASLAPLNARSSHCRLTVDLAQHNRKRGAN